MKDPFLTPEQCGYPVNLTGNGQVSEQFFVGIRDRIPRIPGLGAFEGGFAEAVEQITIEKRAFNLAARFCESLKNKPQSPTTSRFSGVSLTMTQLPAAMASIKAG